MMRIARYCATRLPGSLSLSAEERYEAAMTGIVEYLADNGGWPDGELRDLYHAAGNAIAREARERVRHVRQYWAYWHEPGGAVDSLAEAVTERVATWELVWGFTEDEWAACWAMGQAIAQGGGLAMAGALLGWPDYRVSQRLNDARRKARQWWICPDETPQSFWRAGGRGNLSKLDQWRKSHNAWQGIKERREAA
jgi:hypothetical protein